jgi:hypothetical protein
MLRAHCEFHILAHHVPGLYIRANQGHSIGSVSVDMEQLTSADDVRSKGRRSKLWCDLTLCSIPWWFMGRT